MRSPPAIARRRTKSTPEPKRRAPHAVRGCVQVRCVDVNRQEVVMGLLDNLVSGVLGQAESAAVPALISAVLGKGNLGGLAGIVNQLQQGGLATQVQSWLGNGANMPVSADQLRGALGSDQVKQLAQHFGLPIDQALNLLSAHLPDMVDKASPNGVLQPS
jgi:uncharacterized protein YidB (DUF937 family)